MILAKAVSVVAAGTMLAAGGGATIAHLTREVRTLQHQVYVLHRSADAFGIQFGNGPVLTCVRTQAPDFGRSVSVLPRYNCPALAPAALEGK